MCQEVVKMISIQRLLNAVNKKVVNWQFADCYETLVLAKKGAVKLYIKCDVIGVIIRPIRHGKFATFYLQEVENNGILEITRT